MKLEMGLIHVLYLCMCVYLVHAGTHVGQKMASHFLTLELNMVVNYHVVLRTAPRSSARIAAVLICWAISSPWALIFKLFLKYCNVGGISHAPCHMCKYQNPFEEVVLLPHLGSRDSIHESM